MRGMFDFSSGSAIVSTVMGVLLMTLMVMGVRLLFMQTIQKRRERENRQINERLRTLIAAYKVLGGSFTGNLTVNPVHLREARALAQLDAPPEALLSPAPEETDEAGEDGAPSAFVAERQRRIRDTVEAALSDIILLGTEDQVRLAAQAAQDMVAGRSVQTAQLVASLRHYIRGALYLESIPADVVIPNQGPLRPANSAGAASGRRNSAAEEAGGRGRNGGGGGAAGSSGMGAMGLGVGLRKHSDDS